jgi:hypothetical protein
MKPIIKISFILMTAVVFQNNTKAQLSVASNGSTSINTSVSDWGSGLRVTVPTVNGCAYSLNYAGSDVFYVCAQGWTWSKVQGYYGASDLKFKENINKIRSPLSILKKLNGVYFDYKGIEKQNGQRIGLIAQEVEKVLPGIVRTMPDSSLAITYSDLIPLLIEAVKMQQLQIDSLKQLMTKKNSGSLKSGSNDTAAEYAEAAGIENNESEKLGSLGQNSPNPWSQSTKISYWLSAGQLATVNIFDMNGVQLKKIPIDSGNGSVTINGSEFRPGIYVYNLQLADGKTIATKTMILTQ